MKLSEKKKIIEKAFEIAKKDLRSNYGKLGIYAGPKNHHEYWARDSFFASLGSLDLKDYKAVKKNLDLFTKYQKPNGHIPLRVEERSHVLGVLGFNAYHKSPKAIFRPSQPWAGTVIDSNPLYLIAVSNYVKASGDDTWLKKNNQAVQKAIQWLVSKVGRNGLVTEGRNAGWADMTFKNGNVHYTNIITWYAFKLLCDVLSKDGAQYCLTQKGRLEKAINKEFWDKDLGFFIDNINLAGKKHRWFTSDGNLLSIYLGFATTDQSRKILKYIDDNIGNKIPVPIYLKRPSFKHSFMNSIVFSNYKLVYTFMWWGGISAVCRLKIGDKEGAFDDLFIQGRVITKSGTVPEIVDLDGDPVETLFYKSEMRIAWAAGTFVHAVKDLEEEGLL